MASQRPFKRHLSWFLRAIVCGTLFSQQSINSQATVYWYSQFIHSFIHSTRREYSHLRKPQRAGHHGRSVPGRLLLLFSISWHATKKAHQKGSVHVPGLLQSDSKLESLLKATLIRVAFQKSDSYLGSLLKATLIRVAFQKSDSNLESLFKSDSNYFPLRALRICLAPGGFPRTRLNRFKTSAYIMKTTCFLFGTPSVPLILQHWYFHCTFSKLQLGCVTQYKTYDGFVAWTNDDLSSEHIDEHKEWTYTSTLDI